MASTRSLLQFLRKKIHYQSSTVSSLNSLSKWQGKGTESLSSKSVRGLALLGGGVSGITTMAYADEAEGGSDCPSYPWPSKDVLSSYDPTLFQREQQRFQSDCASCHGGLSFSHKDRAGFAQTDGKARNLAAEIEVMYGLDLKDGKHSCPRTKNAVDQAAGFADEGPYALDLSSVAKNSIRALLTGCRDPPAGISIRNGLHYNPYFFSNTLLRPTMTEAQMGKGMVTFSSWTA